jgi:hypothetical protein
LNNNNNRRSSRQAQPPHGTTNRQATQYVPTIEAFEDHHWESILEAVREILSEGSRRKRSVVSGELEEAEAEDNYILISDKE